MKLLALLASAIFIFSACGTDDATSADGTEDGAQTTETATNELSASIVDVEVTDLTTNEVTTLGEVVDGDKPVLFWSFAAWCPNCKAEAPGIDAFAAANPDYQVIGVGSAANEADTRGFITETGVEVSDMVWVEETNLWAELGFSGRTENLVASGDLTEAFDNNTGGLDEDLVSQQLASLS